MTNRLYTGEHYDNRTENVVADPTERCRRPTKRPRRRWRPAAEWVRVPWPALLDEETFALAERQLQLNRERSPRRTRQRYLLATLLVCGSCGRRLGGHAGVASGRSECTRRRSSELPERRCPLRSIAQPDIEPLVWEHIRTLLSRPDVIVASLHAHQDDGNPPLSDAERELKRIERQRGALGREEQRLVDAYQVGALELDELKARRQHLRAAVSQLAERAEVVRRQVAQAQQAASLTDHVTTFCQRVQAQLVEPSFEIQQQILRLVVERIIVTDDRIVIEHIIPGDTSGRLHLRPVRTGESAGRARIGDALE